MSPSSTHNLRLSSFVEERGEGGGKQKKNKRKRKKKKGENPQPIFSSAIVCEFSDQPLQCRNLLHRDSGIYFPVRITKTSHSVQRLNELNED